MTINVLIIDDEKDIRMMIGDILQDNQYNVLEADNAENALKIIKENEQIDLVILDIWLEGSQMDGIEILKKIKKKNKTIPVIMISGHGNIETAVEAIKIGAYDYIEKPFQYDRLLLVVSRALEASELKKENIQLKRQNGKEEEIIGISSEIANIKNIIEKIASSGSRVFITGAPGVGKEVVARCIHQKSGRADMPFIPVNCAVMDPDRIENELFGQETISGVKIGILEIANGGTILLDEILDMPLRTQGKILRMLQDQTFMRNTGEQELEVDVRIIATSNRDVKKAIEKGEFREDLYYRLNVVPINVPSLEYRREDIPCLMQYFMQKAAIDTGVKPLEITREAAMILQSYNWPGNVRQLKNIMDWLVVMYGHTVDNKIYSNMLPSEISFSKVVSMPSGKMHEYLSMNIKDAREAFEKDYLINVLNKNKGNVSETARQIGMERSALHRKLKMLGIN